MRVCTIRRAGIIQIRNWECNPFRRRHENAYAPERLRGTHHRNNYKLWTFIPLIQRSIWWEPRYDAFAYASREKSYWRTVNHKSREDGKNRREFLARVLSVLEHVDEKKAWNRKKKKSASCAALYEDLWHLQRKLHPGKRQRNDTPGVNDGISSNYVFFAQREPALKYQRFCQQKESVRDAPVNYPCNLHTIKRENCDV